MKILKRLTLIGATILSGSNVFAQSDECVVQSQDNLNQLSLVIRMYANESPGELYPPYGGTNVGLMFAASEVYPEYFSDTTVLLNPCNSNYEALREVAANAPLQAINDSNYIYLAYLIRNNQEMKLFVQGYLAYMAAGSLPPGDLEYDGQTIYRLSGRDGMVSLRNTPIPVLLERPGAQRDGSINVWFFDSSMKNVPFGEFPNTVDFFEQLHLIQSQEGKTSKLSAESRGAIQGQMTDEEAAGMAACFGCSAFSFVILLSIVIGLVINICVLVWVARDAKSRGMDSAAIWMILVFFTGLFGLVIYIFSRPQGDLRQCGHCGNKRLASSASCPNCGNV
jgi:hypothetical protein